MTKQQQQIVLQKKLTFSSPLQTFLYLVFCYFPPPPLNILKLLNQDDFNWKA